MISSTLKTWGYTRGHRAPRALKTGLVLEQEAQHLRLSRFGASHLALLATWTKRTSQTHSRLFRCHFTFLCPLREPAKRVRNALTELLYSQIWDPCRAVNPSRTLSGWEQRFITFFFFFLQANPWQWNSKKGMIWGYKIPPLSLDFTLCCLTVRYFTHFF